MHAKKWKSSLKLVVILAQCRYTEIAQIMFNYSDIQYSSLTLDKNWTVWFIERYSMSTYTGVANFQKNSQGFGLPCEIDFKTEQ